MERKEREGEGRELEEKGVRGMEGGKVEGQRKGRGGKIKKHILKI